MAERKNPHDGHRQRMKDRLLRDGLGGFADHEVFEMLLYYAQPYRDTNELGHRLVERFGSLVGVLEADYADLIRVDGITPHMATLLVLCGQLNRRYAREQYAVGRLLYTTEDYGNCALPWFIGEKVESVVLISMDNRCRLLNTTRIFTGSVNSTHFNFRELVRQTLQVRLLDHLVISQDDYVSMASTPELAHLFQSTLPPGMAAVADPTE